MDFLYDLRYDPTEEVNLMEEVLRSAALRSRYEVISASADSWLTKVGEEDSAYDPEAMLSAMEAANGFAPWRNDTTKRLITQKYSYADAPNIIFIVVDDLGNNEIGYQSTYQSWVTPFIDSLAMGGIRLSNYYTHEYCMPSRAALLTGRYGFRYGMQTIDLITTAGGPKHELPLSAVTIGEEFQSAGYRTSILGKWHMGYSALARYPTYRGFDYFYGYMEGAFDYLTKKTDLDFGPKQKASYLDWFENEGLVTDPDVLSEEMYGAIDLQHKAEAVIIDHALHHNDQPLFMYYATPLVHSPFKQLPDRYMSTCKVTTAAFEAEKCGMLVLLDEMVQNISCILTQQKMWDNTVLVLTSDNGAMAQFLGGNYPYRGHKFNIFRGAQTVPALIYGNSVIPKASRGTMWNGLTHATDWLPTLMGLATNKQWKGSYNSYDSTGTGSTGTGTGTDTGTDHTILDGVDFFPAMLANTSSPRVEIAHYADKYGFVGVQLGELKYTRANAIAEFTVPPDDVLPGLPVPTAMCAIDVLLDSTEDKDEDTDTDGGIDIKKSITLAQSSFLSVFVIAGSVAVLLLGMAAIAKKYDSRRHQAASEGEDDSMSTPSTHALVNDEEDTTVSSSSSTSSSSSSSSSSRSRGGGSGGGSGGGTVNHIHSFSIAGDDEDEDEEWDEV